MKTFSISGFGGSYEWACQTMLQRGIEWLKLHPSFDFKQFSTFKNVYGIVIPKSPEATELENFINDTPKLKAGGTTGAMNQAVIGHLSVIHSKGFDYWFSSLEKHRKGEKSFEFDGTEASCGNEL